MGLSKGRNKLSRKKLQTAKPNFHRPEQFKDHIKTKYKIGIEKDSYYHAGENKRSRDPLSEGDCNFDSDEYSSDEDDIPPNPNHVAVYEESDDESSCDEDED